MLALKLGILSAANLVLGFAFQWLALVQLGPGAESDALFAAMTVPQLVLAVVTGSLVYVLVPLLADEPQWRQRRYVWTFLVVIGGLFALMALTLALAAPFWVPLLLPGFDSATANLTVALTRIQLGTMVLTGINAVQAAALNAQRKFVWVELGAALAGALALGLLVALLPGRGAEVAAWLLVLKSAVQTLAMHWAMYWAMGRVAERRMETAILPLAWRRLRPLLVGAVYYKTEPLFDRFLLSGAAPGSLSLFYLAQQLLGGGSQILGKALAAPLVPILSAAAKAGAQQQFVIAYRRALLQAGVLGGGALALIALGGPQLLALLVGHGNLTQSNVDELWWLLMGLGGTLVGGVLGQLTSSALYALGDTRTPTRIGILSYTVYIPLKLAAYYKFGIMGLAVASSAFLVANLVFQGLAVEAARASGRLKVLGNE